MREKVYPISMAVLWGIVFATAMHSWVLGMCLGLNMGIAFGLFDSDKENKQEQELRISAQRRKGEYDNERTVCKMDADFGDCLFCGSSVHDC